MRPVRAVGLYLAVVFFGGALLAPWLYSLVQSVSTVLPGLETLASKPFHRYLNRCLLVLAVLGLPLLLRAVELRSWRLLGLSWRADAGRHIGWGFLFGFCSLAMVVLIVLAAGARELRYDASTMAMLKHLFKAGLTATLVSVIEELVFRGALFGALRKTFHWTMALGVSSVVYALVHFLERPSPVASVGWLTGLVVLGDMVRGFAEMEKLVPGFFNLTLAGIILGLAYQRSGSLFFPIGLHAGWIFWLKTYGFITAGKALEPTWFFGTAKLINGWLAFAVLGAVLALLYRAMVPTEPNVGWKERRMFQ